MSDVPLFNNCRGRRHAELFGPDAFFDLETEGRQATQAIDLRARTICVVAQEPDDAAQIRFDHYEFKTERVIPDPKTFRDVRVLFGELIDSERLSKLEAAQRSVYGGLFNVNGHFKQTSVVNA